MKYIPFVAIFVLTFFPIAVEGTLVQCLFASFLILYVLFGGCFEVESDGCDSSRTLNGCHALGGYMGLNSTVINDQCSCDDSGLSIKCTRMKEQICISPFDPVFCTNYTDDISDGGVYETKLSSKPLTGQYFTTQVTISIENIFDFHFEAVDGASSESKKYTKCEILFNGWDDCTSCDICDNGIDFKYDCSNTNYTVATDTLTSFRPGPKVETCFPVANIIPSY